MRIGEESMETAIAYCWTFYAFQWNTDLARLDYETIFPLDQYIDEETV